MDNTPGSAHLVWFAIIMLSNHEMVGIWKHDNSIVPKNKKNQKEEEKEEEDKKGGGGGRRKKRRRRRRGEAGTSQPRSSS